MKNLAGLSEEELEQLVQEDHPSALTEKGQRSLARGELKTARKFLTLASVLGEKGAHVELARIYEDEDNFEEAYELYALAYSKGEESVLPQIARLIMMTDAKLGMDLLRQNAMEGHLGCIKELVMIYESKPDKAENKKELKFWTSKLAAAEKELSAENGADNNKK